MRAKGIVGIALAGVLLAPGTAWAGPGGDPVCATDGTNCEPQPTTHGPDRICDLNPRDCAASTHTVRRGEWLWKIARASLAQQGKSTATPNVRKIADMIYADNRRTIGANKNRLRVGQRLTIRATDGWPV